MYFIIPILESDKPRFDAHVEGILFDNNKQLAINHFISGGSVLNKASSSYKIKSDNRLSKIGKIRDRLITKIHGTPLLVVSEKFKTFFQSNFLNHGEFFPVEIDNVNHKPLQNYYICNLIKKYDCIDYDKSEIQYEDPSIIPKSKKIHSAYHLVLDDSEIPDNVHIFLLDNVRRPLIIVSNEFKKMMEINAFTGFKYIKPENYAI